MPNLTAIPEWKPADSDRWREWQLTQLMAEINAKPSKQRQRELYQRYTYLHDQRSPEYIAYLEQKKGIYRT